MKYDFCNVYTLIGELICEVHTVSDHVSSMEITHSLNSKLGAEMGHFNTFSVMD